jgi:hypothetical protein
MDNDNNLRYSNNKTIFRSSTNKATDSALDKSITVQDLSIDANHRNSSADHSKSINQTVRQFNHFTFGSLQNDLNF